MDHEPLPTRTSSPALRWVVALLLVVAGGAGLVPAVEGDEISRVQSAVVVDQHQSVVRRRERRLPRRATPRRRPRVIAALAARVRPLVAGIEARRGPPRTPCVVALT